MTSRTIYVPECQIVNELSCPFCLCSIEINQASGLARGSHRGPCKHQFTMARLTSDCSHIWRLQWGKECCSLICLPDEIETLEGLFPGLRGHTLDCPKEGCSSSLCLVGMIIHLNDDHQFTREEIADWLDSFDDEITSELTTTRKKIATFKEQ